MQGFFMIVLASDKNLQLRLQELSVKHMSCVGSVTLQAVISVANLSQIPNKSLLSKTPGTKKRKEKKPK